VWAHNADYAKVPLEEGGRTRYYIRQTRTGDLVNQANSKKLVSFTDVNKADAWIAQNSPDIPWGTGSIRVGYKWEDYLEPHLPAGSRLPPKFKTFDYFEQVSGKAISAKTLDTATPVRIADPTAVFTTLTKHIDSAAKFKSYSLLGRTLTASQITAREVHVAIPKATTPAQWQQIHLAGDYAKTQGVTLNITVVN